jgi:hypothetical protein
VGLLPNAPERRCDTLPTASRHFSYSYTGQADTIIASLRCPCIQRNEDSGASPESIGQMQGCTRTITSWRLDCFVRDSNSTENRDRRWEDAFERMVLGTTIDTFDGRVKRTVHPS